VDGDGGDGAGQGDDLAVLTGLDRDGALGPDVLLQLLGDRIAQGIQAVTGVPVAQERVIDAVPGLFEVALLGAALERLDPSGAIVRAGCVTRRRER